MRNRNEYLWTGLLLAIFYLIVAHTTDDGPAAFWLILIFGEGLMAMGWVLDWLSERAAQRRFKSLVETLSPKSHKGQK